MKKKNKKCGDAFFAGAFVKKNKISIFHKKNSLRNGEIRGFTVKTAPERLKIKRRILIIKSEINCDA